MVTNEEDSLLVFLTLIKTQESIKYYSLFLSAPSLCSLERCHHFVPGPGQPWLSLDLLLSLVRLGHHHHHHQIFLY